MCYFCHEKPTCIKAPKNNIFVKVLFSSVLRPQFNNIFYIESKDMLSIKQLLKSYSFLWDLCACLTLCA